MPAADAEAPPPPAPRPHRWGTLVGLAIALVGVLAVADPRLVPWGASARAHLASALDHLAPPALAQALEHGAAASLLAAGLLTLGACLLPRPGALPRRPELLPLGVGLVLLLEPVLHLGLLGLLAWRPWPQAGDLLLPRVGTPSPLVHACWLVLTMAVAPLAEEFFFRGRLVPWLRASLDPVSAVTLSALAFAVAHTDPCQMLVALPVGLLLGAVRVRGGSLTACVLMHATHNGLLMAAGSTVIADPWAGVALWLASTACLLLAAFWPGRAGWLTQRQAAITALSIAACLAALEPAYQRMQERSWLAAMARILAYGRLQDDYLLERVDAQCARGSWSAARQRALAQALLRIPVRPQGRIDPERQVWLVARLDPDALAGLDPGQAAIAFEALAECPREMPSHDQAARVLARAQPAVFVRELAEAPESIERWLPLPAQAELLRAVLPAGETSSRAALLVACERRYPGAVAAAILPLPARDITPVERGFLRRHYENAEQLIAALPPVQAAAWRRPADAVTPPAP